jgi:hypothetical protein
MWVTDAADWSPAAFVAQKSQKAWTVSYKDALRHAMGNVKPDVRRERSKEATNNSIMCSSFGNIDSRSFFAEMVEVQADTKEHRWRCRVGAERSRAREEEEPADFCPFLKNINAARQLRDITRSTTPAGLDGTCSPDVELPGCLSHLSTEPLPSSRQVYDGYVDARFTDDPLNEALVAADAANLATVGAELGIEPESLSVDWADADAAAIESPRDATDSQSVRGATPDGRSSRLSNAVEPGRGSVAFVVEEPLTPSRDDSDEEDGCDQDDARRCTTQTARSEDWVAGSDGDGDGDTSLDRLKKRAGVRRFKNVITFSSKFKPIKPEEKTTHAELRRRKEISDQAKRHHETEVMMLTDKDIAWFNLIFEMQIETEFQFQHGFPIAVLTMLDAIYPKKVPWHRVEWRFNYKHAGDRNYSLLENVWQEVGMEKTRCFMPTQTTLRIENMRESVMHEKLAFLRLMRAWFDQRIYWAPKYNAMERRFAFVRECKMKGYEVTFPGWIPFDAVDYRCQDGIFVRRKTTHRVKWEGLPEFQRFVCFLGSTECQEM